MPWPKGKPRSEETRARIAVAMRGNKHAKGTVQPDSANRSRREKQLGDLSSRWLGQDISYIGVHRRLRLRLAGRPCAYCGGDVNVQSALLHSAPAERVFTDEHGRYSVCLDDYAPLCASCHNRYDRGDRLGGWEPQ